MALRPIFSGDPSVPLWIDNGSGVLVPAWAGTPCACCGAAVSFCECTCTRFVSQVSAVEIVVSGFVNFTCPARPAFGQNEELYTFTGLNGTYAASGASGNISLGTLGNYADPGIRVRYQDDTIYSGQLEETYVYQANISVSCLGSRLYFSIAFQEQFFFDTIPAGSYTYPTNGATVEFIEICSLTHPSASGTKPEPKCSLSDTYEWTIVGIATCNGCTCP